jgi:putative membrane protein
MIDMQIYSETKEPKWAIIEWTLTLLIDAFVLILASKIFKGFYVESYWYAIITSLVIMLLDITVKPFLKVIAFPITVLSVGLLYPFINVIILKLAGLLMGSHFNVEGWIVPFFVAIFISFMTLLLDSLITKRIVGGK